MIKSLNNDSHSHYKTASRHKRSKSNGNQDLAHIDRNLLDQPAVVRSVDLTKATTATETNSYPFTSCEQSRQTTSIKTTEKRRKPKKLIKTAVPQRSNGHQAK